MIDTRFMYKLLKSTEKQVRHTVIKELRFNGYKPVVKDNYIYAAGTVPVLLVAHYDTVFEKPPVFVKNVGGVLTNSATGVSALAFKGDGIGADDRAGIYAVLELIKRHHCHVLFTGGEEIGGVGSTDFIADYSELPVNYMIQFDRRNANDAVYYDGANKEFEEFVTAAGFVTAQGSFTDICYLAPHFGVAAVNLSVGYRNEHTAAEELHLNELDDTIRKTRAHLLDCDKKFEWVEDKYSRYMRGSLYPSYEYDMYDEIPITIEYLADNDLTAYEVIMVNAMDETPFDTAIGRFVQKHMNIPFSRVTDMYEDYEYDLGYGMGYDQYEKYEDKEVA